VKAGAEFAVLIADSILNFAADGHLETNTNLSFFKKARPECAGYEVC
jgi:hypothetical protein